MKIQMGKYYMTEGQRYYFCRKYCSNQC